MSMPLAARAVSLEQTVSHLRAGLAERTAVTDVVDALSRARREQPSRGFAYSMDETFPTRIVRARDAMAGVAQFLEQARADVAPFHSAALDSGVRAAMAGQQRLATFIDVLDGQAARALHGEQPTSSWVYMTTNGGRSSTPSQRIGPLLAGGGKLDRETLRASIDAQYDEIGAHVEDVLRRATRQADVRWNHDLADRARELLADAGAASANVRPSAFETEATADRATELLAINQTWATLAPDVQGALDEVIDQLQVGRRGHAAFEPGTVTGSLDRGWDAIDTMHAALIRAINASAVFDGPARASTVASASAEYRRLSSFMDAFDNVSRPGRNSGTVEVSFVRPYSASSTTPGRLGQLDVSRTGMRRGKLDLDVAREELGASLDRFQVALRELAEHAASAERSSIDRYAANATHVVRELTAGPSRNVRQLVDPLVAARTARGLDEVELSNMSGVAVERIAQLERGEAEPTLQELLDLSGVLGLRLGFS